MVYYDVTEKKHYVPIPRDFARDNSFKYTFIDRNRVSKLPMKSVEPLFGEKTNERK